ncbi:MAG: tetratricopeptide repeat protein [Bacteroidia bacterium]
MAKTTKEKPEAAHQNVVEERSGFERFVEENSQVLMIAGAVILAGILGFLGYQQFIQKPAQKEAQSNIFMAQDYFARDSLNLALNGDGQNMGFVDIADKYSNTKTGNLASYYAGIIYMRQGQYEVALDYLEDFSSDSKVISAFKYGLIGDAHVQLGDHDKAVSSYEEAVEADENSYTAPMFLKKLGLLRVQMGEHQKALEAYERIKNDYPESNEAGDIEKYISQMEAQLFVERK